MRKKRAKGFYTLSSKASADQRVLVVLFNGYVTFFAYEISGPGAMYCSQSEARQCTDFLQCILRFSGRVE